MEFGNMTGSRQNTLKFSNEKASQEVFFHCNGTRFDMQLT